MPAADPAIARLTAGLASGDEAAFREFHRLYFDRLYEFLLAIARGNEDEAAEALQQTLLRVARYAKVFNTEEVFWSWLKALARSAARDAGRQRQRYAALLERFFQFCFSRRVEPASSDEHHLSDLLSEILEQLPAEDRRLIEAKYMAGETVKELAAQTGASEKAIQARLGRLRGWLKTCLIEHMRKS